MRLKLLHVDEDLNSWKWCFADDDEVRFSRIFSIDFSSGKPRDWNIFVPELADLEQMIKICQEACSTDFITIECDEKNEEKLKENLKIIMPYVVKLSSIICLDYDNKGFMVMNVDLKDKCWEVQINC